MKITKTKSSVYPRKVTFNNGRVSPVPNQKKFKSDFINPFTGEQAIPHDIAEAKMYLFDASSPKEAVERMNVLWQQKKELQKKDSNENSIKDEGCHSI